jgi:DNA-binding MarR family transcriptional regulator
MEPISEKEFELINILATQGPSSQRQLALKVGVSLGMANLLIKRLATKGFLRIRQLNRRKVEYLLTAAGLAEKTKKSYRYTLKTLRSLTELRARIQAVIGAEYQRGARHFAVVGEGDLSDLTVLALQQCGFAGVSHERWRSDVRPPEDCCVLHTDEEPSPLLDARTQVHVLTAISTVTEPTSANDNRNYSKANGASVSNERARMLA